MSKRQWIFSGEEAALSVDSSTGREQAARANNCGAGRADGWFPGAASLNVSQR
jgi:hypothetical protein